jgi:hypothetical protein
LAVFKVLVTSRLLWWPLLLFVLTPKRVSGLIFSSDVVLFLLEVLDIELVDLWPLVPRLVNLDVVIILYCWYVLAHKPLSLFTLSLWVLVARRPIFGIVIGLAGNFLARHSHFSLDLALCFGLALLRVLGDGAREVILVLSCLPLIRLVEV